MGSVPMPKGLSAESVEAWLHDLYYAGPPPWPRFTAQARAVRALVREKVREAITATRVQERRNDFTDDDAIVSCVMGEDAPRG